MPDFPTSADFPPDPPENPISRHAPIASRNPSQPGEWRIGASKGYDKGGAAPRGRKRAHHVAPRARHQAPMMSRGHLRLESLMLEGSAPVGTPTPTRAYAVDRTTSNKATGARAQRLRPLNLRGIIVPPCRVCRASMRGYVCRGFR